jgi:predicted transcriptional regulator
MIALIKEKGVVSSSEIATALTSISAFSLTTVKRILARLVSDNLVVVIGHGRGTKYSISPAFEIVCAVDIDRYYEKESNVAFL